MAESVLPEESRGGGQPFRGGRAPGLSQLPRPSRIPLPAHQGTPTLPVNDWLSASLSPKRWDPVRMKRPEDGSSSSRRCSSVG
jgi:hypothetical protein